MKGRNAELDKKSKVVALKVMKLNGRTYQRGDVIGDTTIDLRTKEKLYKVGFLTTVEDYEVSRNKYGTKIVEAEAPVAPVEEVTEEVVVLVEEATVEEAQEESVEEVAAPVAPAPVAAETRVSNKKATRARRKNRVS